MKRIGFTSGSFDPVTNGHRDVIARAARMVDTPRDRHRGASRQDAAVHRCREDRAPQGGNGGDRQGERVAKIEIVTFDNLTVDGRAAAGASLIFRGLRDGMTSTTRCRWPGMNGAMAPGYRTVFLPASPGVRHITATLVRQIALMGGDVSELRVAGRGAQLKAKAAQRSSLKRRGGPDGPLAVSAGLSPSVAGRKEVSLPAILA